MGRDAVSIQVSLEDTDSAIDLDYYAAARVRDVIQTTLSPAHLKTDLHPTRRRSMDLAWPSASLRQAHEEGKHSPEAINTSPWALAVCMIGFNVSDLRIMSVR